MARQFGTYSLLDTLATHDAANVFEYGIDDFYVHMRDMNRVHNAQVREMYSLFVERTTDRIDRFGVDVVEGEFIPVGEDGIVDVQKAAIEGYDIGQPMRDYQFNVQWTERYLDKETVAGLTKRFIGMQNGDLRRLRRDILYAIFHGANYTFIDYLNDRVSMPVKALLNADGQAIPRDEFGNTFNGATHTHYLARAGGALAASDIDALINTVTEHGVNGGTVVLYINKAQLAAVSAFTSNFEALQAPLIDRGPGSTADVIRGDPRNNPYQIDNRLVGLWNGYVWVWIKPWIPANYLMAIIVGGTNEKTLRFREDDSARWRGLRELPASVVRYPFGFEGWAHQFGIGVWNRMGAAVLYTGNTVYAEPTLTL